MEVSTNDQKLKWKLSDKFFIISSRLTTSVEPSRNPIKISSTQICSLQPVYQNLVLSSNSLDVCHFDVHGGNVCHFNINEEQVFFCCFATHNNLKTLNPRGDAKSTSFKCKMFTICQPFLYVRSCWLDHNVFFFHLTLSIFTHRSKRNLMFT